MGKTFKKIHESKEVANKHILKIKKRGGSVKKTVKNGKIILEYSFNEKKENIWYHGSDNKISKLLPSEDLKLDYKTENGAWLTSDKHQAGFYGKYISEFDVSKLRILDMSDKNKMRFVVEYMVSIGSDKNRIIQSIKLENEFKDVYDYVLDFAVDEKGYDAVKLKGEFEKGYDLWVTKRGTKKLIKVF